MTGDANKPRVALVTGASRGLGASIAKALLDEGYAVAIGYQHQAEQARALAPDNPMAFPVQMDIGDAASVEKAFSQIAERLGPVDILVNNAAIAQEKDFLTLTDADWERMFNINLFGAVRCVRQALPGMLERGFGRIINISSVGGQWGGLNQVHYAGTKAALINLTRSLAKLYSKQGITSNAIAPGLVATDMSAAELQRPSGQEKVKKIPLGRLGTPEEIGATVVYLASDEAGYMTGHTININGGMYLA